MKKQKREHIADRVVNTGLAVNIGLAILKLTAGIIGHSRALMADGINSTSDVAYYIAVKIFTRIAGKPADREHPYGHHQMESIAAVVIGAFVITTAIAIFWNSINAAFDLWAGGTDSAPVGYRLFSLSIVCGTILVKIILYIHTKTAARITGNPALLALAYDHRNDIFSSAGAAIGISLSYFNLPWGDPLAGACVALIILKTGIHILRESSDDLMDTLPGDGLERQVRKNAMEIPGVLSVEHITAHRFGPYFAVNITIGVDGNQSVAEGDEIATSVEKRLFKSIELLQNIHVHFHPPRAPAVPESRETN